MILLLFLLSISKKCKINQKLEMITFVYLLIHKGILSLHLNYKIIIKIEIIKIAFRLILHVYYICYDIIKKMIII